MSLNERFFSVVDGVMDWSWQWLGLRRRHVLMILASAWLVPDLVQDHLDAKKGFPVWSWIFFLLMMSLRLRDYQREKEWGNEIYNGMLVMVRTLMLSTVLRVVFLLNIVIFVPLLLLVHASPVDLINVFTMSVYLWMMDGLVSTKPRKKIKLPSLSWLGPQAVGAH